MLGSVAAPVAAPTTAGGYWVSTTSTYPFLFATADTITVTGTYEAA
jgi:hypothetical protein